LLRGDVEKPCPRVLELRALAQHAVGREKRLLHDVLGGRTVADVLAGEGEQRGSVAVVEGGERLLVAGGGARGEPAIVAIAGAATRRDGSVDGHLAADRSPLYMRAASLCDIVRFATPSPGSFHRRFRRVPPCYARPPAGTFPLSPCPSQIGPKMTDMLRRFRRAVASLGVEDRPAFKSVDASPALYDDGSWLTTKK